MVVSQDRSKQEKEVDTKIDQDQSNKPGATERPDILSMNPVLIELENNIDHGKRGRLIEHFEPLKQWILKRFKMQQIDQLHQRKAHNDHNLHCEVRLLEDADARDSYAAHHEQERVDYR